MKLDRRCSRPSLAVAAALLAGRAAAPVANGVRRIELRDANLTSGDVPQPALIGSGANTRFRNDARRCGVRARWNF